MELAVRPTGKLTLELPGAVVLDSRLLIGNVRREARDGATELLRAQRRRRPRNHRVDTVRFFDTTVHFRGVMSLSGVSEAIEGSHQACAAFVNGDPTPMKDVFSHRDDATIANPFGPPARGWKQVEETFERAATNWHGGVPESFDLVTRYDSTELAFTVEIERYKAKLGDAKEMVPVALRVTQVYRPEEGGVWKIVHRHADHMPTARTAESLLST